MEDHIYDLTFQIGIEIEFGQEEVEGVYCSTWKGLKRSILKMSEKFRSV
jgi:hypothetical protein